MRAEGIPLVSGSAADLRLGSGSVAVVLLGRGRSLLLGRSWCRIGGGTHRSRQVTGHRSSLHGLLVGRTRRTDTGLKPGEFTVERLAGLVDRWHSPAVQLAVRLLHPQGVPRCG